MSKTMKPPKLYWRFKVLAGFLLIVSVLASQFSDWLQPLIEVPRVLSQSLVLLGGISLIYHSQLLRRHVGASFESYSLLTSGGFFGAVRHPMYSSDIVMYSGLMLFSPNIIAVGVYLIGLAAIYLQAMAEDEYLAFTFFDSHTEWAKGTGLLLPAFHSHN